MTRYSCSFGIVAAAVGILSAGMTTTEALKVVAPSEGMTVVADRDFSVEWTGSSADARFTIDLHYCGSYSFCFDDADNCGFYIATLYGDGDAECDEQDGSCDVLMPEPIAGRSGDGYKVRIIEEGSARKRCSDDFYLLASADAPAVGEEGGPEIAVVEPTADSMAVAGEEYTVEFDYDNGFGSRVGRFKIDLYTETGTGDCGTWVTSICDMPNRGCRDTQGDYDIVIPSDTTVGKHKIRVGLFGDDSVFACSEAFAVVAGGESFWS